MVIALLVIVVVVVVAVVDFAGVLDLWFHVNNVASPKSLEPLTAAPLYTEILKYSPVIQSATVALGDFKQYLPWNVSTLSTTTTTAATATAIPTYTVCTAGEWYLFPSHFFLPSNVRIGYVEGTFHGLLPRYFPSTNLTTTAVVVDNDTSEHHVSDQQVTIHLGTRQSTGEDFNGLNQEVRSRYLVESDCDAFVLVLNNDSNEAIKTSTETETETIHKDDRARNTNQKQSKKKHTMQLILDPANSQSSLARAYFIPKFSSTRNVYREYALLVWD